jgi:uncharacterized repeat protein (TIGR03803 family)
LRTKVLVSITLLALAGASAQAQTYSQFFIFSDGSGQAFSPEPPTNIIEGTSGLLYSTASEYGGGGAVGAVYSLSTGAVESAVADFAPNETQGVYCRNGVTQGTDGNFYGVCTQGGSGTACSNYCGTVYQVTSGGINILHNFQAGAHDGAYPYGPLVQASDGNFYGVTPYGGKTICEGGCGIVFKITPEGAFSILHYFKDTATDGYVPEPGLVQGKDGALYGAVNLDGTGGAIFRLTLAGKISYIHEFHANVDNSYPNGGLILGSDGSLYGTTPGSSAGDLYPNGTVYKLTTKGDFTPLHAFSGPDGDGDNPLGLIQATDGNFYGVTMGTTPPGDGGPGTLYEMTPAGEVTLLHTFNYDTDLSGPLALMQHTDGLIYGATLNNNCNDSECGWGGIFTLDIGANQFVMLQSSLGAAGAEIGIIGQNLNDATAVDFDGTSASFTINSATSITAKVPAGSKSGYVTVTVLGKKVKSNVKFTVK